jgi:hypothetical protein
MMEMFICMTVGVLVGATAGVLVMALCFMARDGGDE